jgi:hypothetical protein
MYQLVCIQNLYQLVQCSMVNTYLCEPVFDDVHDVYNFLLLSICVSIQNWCLMNLYFCPVVTGGLMSNCLLLLWSLVAMGIVTSSICHY